MAADRRDLRRRCCSAALVMWFHDNRYGVPVIAARHRRRAGHHVQLVVEHHQRSAHRLSHAGRPASPALRDDPVHRLRSDVLPRLVLGLLRQLALPVGGRRGRRSVAAQGHRSAQPVGLPAAQHDDPAVLGHDGHLGAPFADPRRPPGPQARPAADDPARPDCSPASRRRNMPTRRSPSKAASTARPSSWRPASTASTSSSARSS